MPSILPVAFSISLALVATTRAATPTAGEEQGAALVPARSPHSLKDTVPVETPGNTVVGRRNGFEVVPEAPKCQSVKIPELKAIKPVFLLNSCQNMSLLERDNGT